MLQFNRQMRILVSTSPLDMRKGIDGVAAVCQRELRENPMSGTVFLFISRSRKHLRILSYDGQGYWLCTKRLSRGRFPYWPKPQDEQTWVKKLESVEASVLIQAGDPSIVRVMPDWRKIA
jgi:transposase